MKTKTIFVCQSCGAQFPRWAGRCLSCESWNTIVEDVADPFVQEEDRVIFKEEPVLLADVQGLEDRRYTTDIPELDRVLGGGIVPGSVILIGGDPGIGKSTLSLQMASFLSQKGLKVLYVSGEESGQQTKMRFERVNKRNNKFLYIVNQVDLKAITEYLNTLKPEVIVIDSIQVMYDSQIGSSPGSVSQVRECSARLTQLAKSQGVSLIIIGHVTKEGTLAGPRVLEHIVDTVLYFEGERYSTYRILRTTKNRFGSTNEIGVFEMTSNGLVEITNPSQIFLSERPKNTSGSVVIPIMEGTRSVLVEIQGLVSRSNFGMVRQKAQGFDPNRLALLAAVLEKKLGLNLQDKDIFLNVAGGMKITDPAADLAVVVAVASAFLDKQVGAETVVLGEVGLSSEVRSVSHIVSRLNEAEKLGFKRCLLPKNNFNNNFELKTKTLQLIPIETVREALGQLT